MKSPFSEAFIGGVLGALFIVSFGWFLVLAYVLIGIKMCMGLDYIDIKSGKNPSPLAIWFPVICIWPFIPVFIICCNEVSIRERELFWESFGIPNFKFQSPIKLIPKDEPEVAK